MTHDEVVVKPGVRQAAFFDLEKTLTPLATEQACALRMARRGEFPYSSLARVLFIYLRYNLGLIGDFDSMKRFGAHVFTGRNHQHDQTSMRQLFDEGLGKQVYPEALALVRRFHEANFEVFIVSATYRFMVAPYAEKLGIDAAHVHAVDLEVDAQGQCTGRIRGTIPHQHLKAAVVFEAGKRGVSLADSYAFGDTFNDVPMLEAVGHPVVVNPGAKLARLAESRGWRRARWRMG